MKNYLFGPNGLATKIVHAKYLSRWIVMGIDVVLSTLVTVFAYWLIRFVREEPVVWSLAIYLALLAATISALAFAILHAGDMAYGNGDDLESDHSLPIDSRLLPASIQRKIDLGSFVGCDDNDGRVGIRAGRVGKFV